MTGGLGVNPGGGALMRINLYCAFHGSTGGGRFAEHFCAAVMDCIPAGLTVRHVIPNDTRAMAEMIMDGHDDDVTLFVPIQNPKFLHLVKGRKIFWYFFESNRIASHIVNLLHGYDEIWTLSPWSHRVLIDAGLPATKVRVMSGGVNELIYRPNPVAHSGFVFLSIGKYEKRKCTDEIIDAFVAEFPADPYPDVTLLLKADFGLFPERIEALKKKTACDARIQFIDGVRSDAEVAVLYNGADAFLFPSRAEGFGLPGIEAMACGVPTLSINYSGCSVYLDVVDGLYRSVDFRLIDIDDPDFDHFFREIYAGEPYGQWAEPDPVSLRAGMRDLYDNRAVWRERAQKASTILHAQFDWHVIARQAIRAVMD